MEELLNKLIEKGWKPGNKDYTKINEVVKIKIVRGDIQINRGDKNIPEDERCWSVLYKSKRELVSKESGLWQFCCDKGLIKMKEGYYWQNIALIHSEEYDYTDYQYWILESALKDEEDLEDFLIENINI